MTYHFAGSGHWDSRRARSLGDSGSNVLGFLIGLALFLTLPVWGLVVALLLVLFLHYVAETTTLSRVIDAVAILRWFDALGRRGERSSPARCR